MSFSGENNAQRGKTGCAERGERGNGSGEEALEVFACRTGMRNFKLRDEEREEELKLKTQLRRDSKRRVVLMGREGPWRAGAYRFFSFFFI